MVNPVIYFVIGTFLGILITLSIVSRQSNHHTSPILLSNNAPLSLNVINSTAIISNPPDLINIEPVVNIPSISINQIPDIPIFANKVPVEELIYNDETKKSRRERKRNNRLNKRNNLNLDHNNTYEGIENLFKKPLLTEQTNNEKPKSSQ